MGISAMQLPSLFVFRSSLLPIKGTLENATIYITTHTSKSRYNIFGHESSSQKARLIFYLSEHKKKFALQRNIGDSYEYQFYETIKLKLNHADEITVWIHQQDIDSWEPEIFQLDTDNTPIIDFNSKKREDNSVMLFIFLAGLGCVILSGLLFYKTIYVNKAGFIFI